MNKSSSWDKKTLAIVSVAFTTTDWSISIFTFGDILLFLSLLRIVTRKQYSIKANQCLILLFTLSSVLLNVLINLLFNSNFILEQGLVGTIKIFYYMTVIIALYNYIRNKELELEFIKIVNITSVVVCIIGGYIYLAVYLSRALPYEFFWHFTRTDISSYIYKGYEMSAVRARSIFSEPAHLGFYLNYILGINYFNKYKYEINKGIDMLITITIILTFSYSSILVMILVKAMHYINFRRISKVLLNKTYIVGVLILIILVFAFWGTIEKTLIIRTQEALSGTDGSAKARIVGSWEYVNQDNILMGNGIGNTAEIFNIYAYVLSDLGLVSFLIFSLLSILIISINFKIGILFMVLNFQKGGYLASGYWILLLILFIFWGKKHEINYQC